MHSSTRPNGNVSDHAQHVAPAVTGHTMHRCDIKATRGLGQLANVKGDKASCATVHELPQRFGEMIAEGAIDIPHGLMQHKRR